MKTCAGLLISVLLFTAAAAAQWNSTGTVTVVSPLHNGVEVMAGGVRATIEALAPDVIRVRYANAAAAKVNRESFAVVGRESFTSPAVSVSQTGGNVEFSTAALRVQIQKSPLRIRFLIPAGEMISEDALPTAFSGPAFRVWKTMPRDEHYFGLGDKAGPIDHRDQAFSMWNTDAYGWHTGTDPLYKSIPFFLALRRGAAYGIFLDNTFRSNFDFGKEARDRYSFGSDGGDLDYYLFYGPDPKHVIENYTALVGRMPLPPLWSLGYQQSRYSYESEARVREIANQFRQRHIPADVIYLDLDYEDARRPFTIDRTKFPTFEGMVHDLAAQGFQIVPIVDLHLKQQVGYAPYDEGMKGDHFVKNHDGSLYVGPVWPGPSVFPDFTRAASREWWGTLFADFSRMGIRGIWNDMNEPAVFVPPDKTMPLDVMHHVEDARQHRTADHREIHNVFGMENVRATYEGLLRLKPDQRPFVLTRAGFAGTWRYAATWTGDNGATWEHYRLTIPTVLSLGISGYAFSGVDVGGFSGSPTPDLLTRWLELGAFLPFFRDHTDKGTRDQEPWVHGPQHEAIRRRYIETRYRLLPYIYTGMEEASRTGLPLMRPVFLEYPALGDAALSDRWFLFGRDMLVVPKMLETVDPYVPKLPPGTWYDFWTGMQLHDNEPLLNPPLDVMPVYIRAGAILPQQPVVQSTAEVPQGPLEISVYPGPDCRGSLYLDDGSSFAYRQGKFYRAEFTCQQTAGEVRIQNRVVSNAFQPWWSEVKYVVMGLPTRPQSVTVGGTPAQWTYDAHAEAISLQVPAAALANEVVIH
jgi:alpha-glucosidase